MAQLLIFIANLSCCATSFVETTKLEARTRHFNVIRCSKVRAISRRSISTVIHGSLFRSMFFIYMFNLIVSFFYATMEFLTFSIVCLSKSFSIIANEKSNAVPAPLEVIKFPSMTTFCVL